MASGLQKGSKGCSDLIIPGVNFPGNDIEMVLAVDATFCQLLCTYHPRCRFFTYFPRERTSASMRFSCYLKGRTSDLPATVQINSETVSGFSHSYHGAQKPCNTYAYSNTEFPGYGERTLRTASFELCRDECTQDPSCQFFSYATTAYADAAKQGICYPKNVMSLPNPTQMDLVPNVTSGFPLRKCEGDIQGYVPPLPIEIPDSTCYFN
ncbi:plasma kallikrein-like isoform X2 [Lissotriton helveticus]